MLSRMDCENDERLENNDDYVQLFLIEKSLEDQIDEDNFLMVERPKSVLIKNQILINTYKPSQINLYKDQDISEIRSSTKPFEDPHFLPGIKKIVNNMNTDFAKILLSMFKIQNKNNSDEINSKIKWKKPQLICYDKRIGNYEFVLDSNGKALSQNFTKADYASYFSSDDIFQGILGDCFMIATILSICNNKEILLHLAPMDNAYRKNMKIGAYHFRLWKLGEWYDVVIDDFLPVDTAHNPLFARNLRFQNEFWISLLEKSIAKFLGNFEVLNGGHTENIAVLFSGGIQNVYYSELILHVTSKSPIQNNQAEYRANSLKEQFGSIEAACPNIEELFFIIAFALKNKNIVGCHSTLQKSNSFGVIRHHQYAVKSIHVFDKSKIVKIQNPHNYPDMIKRTKKYFEFESKLKKLGASGTYLGEFYMQFNDFVNCFDIICVFNLLPEKSVQNLPEKYPKKLKLKCNLFNQWKILHIQGRMSKKDVGAEFRVNFEIRSNIKEHILLTICQNYTTECFLTKVKITKNGTSVGVFHSQVYSMQQIFNLFLDSGKYKAIFIARTEIKNDLDVCVRIFYSRTNENSIQFF
ncbi:Calpain [Brachionus plicatilis]|uniref:Calpain n=1 Tax=Brachionus plicatilis TaxID=10195 RepID=A0A3M7RKM0_BRAPC|nr:Calpain [Brachionus plicatilis]